MTSKNGRIREFFWSSRWIHVKDQLFPWAQWLAFANSVLHICSYIWLTAYSWAFHRDQCKVLKCRYCGARIEITFALDIESPRTDRTCHSVGTKCSREAGTNSSCCNRLPKLWKIHFGFLPRRMVHLQWYFFWRCCTFFNHQNFPDSGSRERKCSPPRIWYSATAKHKRYCCHMTSFGFEFLV